MNQHRMHSDLGFRLMALGFRLRDFIRPPARILEEAGIQPGMTVLDFGCGPGGFSLAAARAVGPHGMVYAVDIHPLAVEMVERAASAAGIVNIRTIHGSSVKVIPDACIDMLLLYDVLHGIPEAATVLSEVHRVVKPSGIISVSDHHMKEDNLVDLMHTGNRFRFAGRGRRTLQFTHIGTGEVSP